VNNVETLVNVPLIIREGGAAYARVGTANSTGYRFLPFRSCGASGRL